MKTYISLPGISNNINWSLFKDMVLCSPCEGCAVQVHKIINTANFLQWVNSQHCAAESNYLTLIFLHHHKIGEIFQHYCAHRQTINAISAIIPLEHETQDSPLSPSQTKQKWILYKHSSPFDNAGTTLESICIRK